MTMKPNEDQNPKEISDEDLDAAQGGAALSASKEDSASADQKEKPKFHAKWVSYVMS